MLPSLTASFFSLTGAGFAEPARYGFADRCRAAGAAGFTGVGLRGGDYAQVRTEESPAGMKAVLADSGVRITEVEFLDGWTSRDPDASAISEQDVIFEMAEVFGPHHVSAGEFGGQEIDVQVTAERLRAVCARAAAFDVQVAVEPFPWSGLKDVATVRAVLDAADAPNAGLLVDVWHFYNSRSTFEDLRELGKERIVAVQLNDGRLVHGDFLTEARAARLLPGDGELDVAGLLACLGEIGFSGAFCVEVGYPEYRALPVRDMADLAFAKATQALRDADW
jgi:sugar phosphate isomerase/epimerase